jgi:sugar phosphate isomerase/epimerase
MDLVGSYGVQAIELGTGNYPGNGHCDPDALLGDPSRARELKKKIEDRGLIISALSQHGNPVHPNEAIAEPAHEVWRKTVRLAELMEVDVVNGFSGCPGDPGGGRYPNWITCAWPSDFAELLEWQWTERLIPYWSEQATYAEAHGVKIGFEMHPGMAVYNPETLLKLRAAAGPAIGCNFDPSHLVWQGIDPVEAVRVLGAEKAIFHVHAKDTYVDNANVRVNGVLDTKDYGDILHRAWTFRTVSYGRPEKDWRDLISALRVVGYDFVLSIEHEDALMSVDEGFSKAVRFLQSIMTSEPAGEMWWA